MPKSHVATCVFLSVISQFSSARWHLRKKSAKNRTKARSGRTLRIRPCNHGCVDNQPFRRILIVTQGLFYAERAGPCGSFLCSCRHSMMRFCAGMRDFRQSSIWEMMKSHFITFIFLSNTSQLSSARRYRVCESTTTRYSHMLPIDGVPMSTQTRQAYRRLTSEK